MQQIIFLIAEIVTDLSFSFIELLLLTRFVMKILGANDFAPVVKWIYQTSQPLVRPFTGIFPTANAEGLFAIEISTIFAIVMFWLVFAIISEIFHYLHFLAERTFVKQHVYSSEQED